MTSTLSSPELDGDRCTAYARSVEAGDIVAGPYVRLACRRHLDDLATGGDRGLVYDTAAAARVITYFEKVLKVAVDGRAAAFVPDGWQAFVLGSLFGWKRRDTAKRRFREAYVETGKGSGKSPLAAGIGMYLLTADGEFKPEIYAAASKRDQAMILFQDAVSMRNGSPVLKSKTTVRGIEPVYHIGYPAKEGIFRPLSSEDGQSGPRPSCALVDELHEHRDSNVITMLEKGFKGRAQPLLFTITNSGFDLNSPCGLRHTASIEMLQGEMSETANPDEIFAYVCALDEGDDPLEDEACWAKTNPSLGVTINPDYLRSQVAGARRIPAERNVCLRLNFCVWTEAETSWLSREVVAPCIARFEPVELKDKGRLCLGADLAAVNDLLALAGVMQTGTVPVLRPDGTKEMLPTFDAWVEAWTPKDTLAEREKRDKAPYALWVKQGHLVAVPGSRIRLSHVAHRIGEIDALFDIEGLAYDRYAFDKLKDELDDLGLEIPLWDHPQAGKSRKSPPAAVVEAARAAGEEVPKGLWMPGSRRAFEELVIEKRIRIRFSPVLNAAIAGARLENDALDNGFLIKSKSTKRIDPAIALCMAVGLVTQRVAPIDGRDLSDFLKHAVTA
jgi:phage terminase large subunit-like protein